MYFSDHFLKGILNRNQTTSCTIIPLSWTVIKLQPLRHRKNIILALTEHKCQIKKAIRD